MTVQEAYKKITNSEELRKKAIEALKAGKAEEFLKEQGIDLTVDQIKEAFQSKKSGELSRSELDMAAGGCDNEVCDQILFSVYTVIAGCILSTIDEASGREINNVQDCGKDL